MGLLYLHTTSISENHWCDKMIWNFLYTMTILFWSFQTVKDKLYDTLKLYKLASNNLVKWSCSVMSDSLWPHGLLPTRLSVHGIFQARGLEWVAISFSRRSSQPRDRTQVSRIVGRHFTIWATRGDLIILMLNITDSVCYYLLG